MTTLYPNVISVYLFECQGLFQRAISQSGSALKAWALTKDPASQAKRLGRLFRCPTENSHDLVACLRRVDARKIALTHQAAMVKLITILIICHYDNYSFTSSLVFVHWASRCLGWTWALIFTHLFWLFRNFFNVALTYVAIQSACVSEKIKDLFTISQNLMSSAFHQV